MDRGFELMIPKAKEAENEFKHEIKFTLFGRQYVLSFKVNRKE